jgi:hypothetical protein
MAILMPSEFSQYAASVVDVSGDQLAAAIMQAQMMAESPMGANRPMELQSVTDVVHLPSTGKALLSRLPIIPNTNSTPITVEVRGGDYTVFGLNFTGTAWVAIDSDQFEIEPNLGELRVKNLTGVSASSFSVGSDRRRGRRRPMEAQTLPQVRVSYWAGFDFSDVSNPAVTAMKSAIASIVITMRNAKIAEGMTSFTLNDFYSVSYAGVADLQQLLEMPLQIFRQYRPRTYF